MLSAIDVKYSGDFSLPIFTQFTKLFIVFNTDTTDFYYVLTHKLHPNHTPSACDIP